MKEILLIFLGGGLGCTARYLSSYLLAKELTSPAATLIINIIGSFIIGYTICRIYNDHQHWAHFAIIIGFCGGFTTFSTFAFDLFTLLKSHDYFAIFIYITMSIFLSVGAVFVGFWVCSNIHQR